MTWFRRTPPPPPRKPHPDGRLEAELQRVMALQRQVRRIEARLEDIRVQRRRLDDLARCRNNGGVRAGPSA